MIMESIKEKVKHILETNLAYEVNDKALDKVLHDWQTNKQHIIEKLGGLIYQSPEPITIVRTHDELAIIWNDFISDLAIYRFYAPGLIEFLEDQGMDAFFKNEVVKSYQIQNGKEIPSGMKISRALKFFISEKPVLDRIQSKYSMILQDAQLSGYLYLSVHPLDFLSISENIYNWHSCHALDGEYAAGNLNYMADSVTVVAYLSSNRQYFLPRFGDEEWNSKKWRTLLYINDSHITIGKGYPFKSVHLTQQCTDSMQQLLGGEWEEITPVLTKSQAKELVEDEPRTLHFNDVLLSSTYRGFVSYNKKSNKTILTPTIVGKSFLCLSCGSAHAEVSDEYVCRECCHYEVCSCCEEPVYDDDYYVIGDDVLCCYCYNETVVSCECCGEEWYRECDVITWRDDLEEYYCDTCYEEILSEMESEEDFDE